MQRRSIFRTRNPIHLILAAAVGGVSLPVWVAPTSAGATTLYWDGDGTATGNNVSGTNLGGTGNWSTTLTNWWDGVSGTDAAWGAGTTNLAIFNGTAGTVTLTNTVPAGIAGLEFDTTGYLITGAGTLNLNGGDINVSTGNATIGSTLATVVAQGATTVNKTGSGTLTLGGTSTSSNTASAGSVFNINGGTVAITKAANAVGIAAATINVNSAILDTSGSASTSAIGTTAILNFTGTGSWVRHATATSSVNNIGTMSGQTIGGGGLLTFQTGGSTTLTGANIFNTDINTSPGSGRSHTWTLTNASDTFTFNGVYAGTGTNSILTFSGPVGSIVTLAGGTANTYAGNIVVTGATLKLNKSSSVVALQANTQVSVDGGGTIQDIGFGGQIASKNILVVGDATAPGGTMDLNSFAETVATVAMNAGVIKSTVSGGKLTIGSTSTLVGVTAVGTGNLISANLDLNTKDTLNVYRRVTVTNPTDVLEISGTISDEARAAGNFTTNLISLEKSGSGKLILSGTNSYTGITRITTGILSINQDRALGAVPGSASTGNITFSGGTLQANDTFTLNSNRGMGGSVIIDVVAGKTLTYAGVMAENNSSGSGFTKTGTGTYSDVQSVNVYSGATTIKSGLYNVSSLTNGFGVTTSTPAVYDTSGSANTIILQGTDTIASLGLQVGMNVGSTNAVNAGSTITGLGNDGITVTISSTITGTPANHNATFGFANSLGFSGNATSSLVLGGTVGTDVGPGLLGYTGSVAGSTNRQFSITGTGGGFSASGTTAAATMTITGAMSAPTGGAGQSLVLTGTNTGNNTISTLITNGATTNVTSLVKSGAGKWLMTNANTYTGGTTISGGTLMANNISGSATGTGAVTVQTTGTLGGSGTIIATTGAVTINGGGTLQGGSGAVGTALTINSDLVLQSNSIIGLSLGASGTHSTLSRTGSGTWTFDGTQAFAISDVGGVTTGFYDNVITGLASDPGTEAGWQIITSQYAGTFAYDGSGNIDLTLSAVPEPTSLAIFGLGTMALCKRRRQRLATNESL